MSSIAGEFHNSESFIDNSLSLYEAERFDVLRRHDYSNGMASYFLLEREPDVVYCESQFLLLIRILVDMKLFTEAL